MIEPPRKSAGTRGAVRVVYMYHCFGLSEPVECESVCVYMCVCVSLDGQTATDERAVRELMRKG